MWCCSSKIFMGFADFASYQSCLKYSGDSDRANPFFVFLRTKHCICVKDTNCWAIEWNSRESSWSAEQFVLLIHQALGLFFILTTWISFVETQTRLCLDKVWFFCFSFDFIFEYFSLTFNLFPGSFSRKHLRPPRWWRKMLRILLLGRKSGLLTIITQKNIFSFF